MRSANSFEKDSVISSMIIGVNVALATAASAGLALAGQPNVAWPICAMVAAVYGVSSTLKLFRRAG